MQFHFFIRKVLIRSTALAALLAVIVLCTGCTRKKGEISLAGDSGRTESIPESSASKTQEAQSPENRSAVEAMTQAVTNVTQAVTSKESSGMLYVHICGAVNAEGVYRLPAGSRAFEAIAAAGGLSEEADASFVNQAAPLSDGMKIRIPTGKETAAAGGVPQVFSEGLTAQTGAGGEGTGSAGSAKINLNTATAAELDALPGIGESYAAAIIAYRDKKGPFSKAEDIMNVSGIGEKLYDKIKDQIFVS